MEHANADALEDFKIETPKACSCNVLISWCEFVAKRQMCEKFELVSNYFCPSAIEQLQ